MFIGTDLFIHHFWGLPFLKGLEVWETEKKTVKCTSTQRPQTHLEILIIFIFIVKYVVTKDFWKTSKCVFRDFNFQAYG